jgi:uncharacterized membrane protein
MEELYVIVLRAAHVVAGAFWIGAAFLFFGFINPTLRHLGPPTNRDFMAYLVGRRRFPRWMVFATSTTIVAGLLLYWRASDGLDPTWISSPVGLGFTLGGAAAIIAFAMGMTLISPTLERLDRLGNEIGASGGPPSAEQLAELQAIDRRLGWTGTADFALLSIAVVFMAISRYLPAAW